MAKSALQKELGKKQRFACREQEVALNLLRTADVLSREGHALFERYGLSAQQFNVLRILRGRAILDRRDFGMTYGKDKIADPVEVRFDVTAGK